MKKKLSITLGAAMLFAGFTTIATAETLKEVYQQALQNDHTFKAARAEYLGGLEDAKTGLAELLPSLNGQVTWSDSETDATNNFNGVTSTSDNESSGYSLKLDQPLFDLGKWHTYQRGKLDSKIAQSNFHAAEQNLIIRTAEAYFNALQAVDNFETAKAEENANSHQLEQTRKRFEVGLIAITDVHEAQAAYDNSVARRLLEEGNLGIRFEELEVITGRSYQHLSPLKDSFQITNPVPEKREDWVKFATENNFALAAASLRAKSAKQSAKVARSGHAPTLSASATYSDGSSEGLSAEGNLFDADSETSEIALTLTVPIFNGGSTSAARRKAAQGYIQAQENYYLAQRNTIQSARSLHLTVLTDVATVKARRQAITSSQSAVEATQAGYEVGTRDLVDVLVAQRTLFTAQRDYSSALYAYVLDTLRLKEVAGNLTEKDIIELDNWLDTSKKMSRTPL